ISAGSITTTGAASAAAYGAADGLTNGFYFTSEPALGFRHTSGGVIDLSSGSLRFRDPSQVLTWLGRSAIYCPVDGNLLLTNQASNAFSLLQFGGQNSLYPALKRNAAAIEIKLADDSNYASVTARDYVASVGQYASASGQHLTLLAQGATTIIRFLTNGA